MCYCFQEQGRFRRTYCLYLQGRNLRQNNSQQEADMLDTSFSAGRQYVSPKRR
jgi:hypothetical protein